MCIALNSVQGKRNMDVEAKLRSMGRRIREIRVSMSLNQKDFGKIGGVGITTQQQYEAGNTPATAAYLFGLEASGVDIGYVLTGRHNDGEAGFHLSEREELFSQLSDRERDAVIAMMTVLVGHGSEADQPLPHTTTTTLHDKGRGYSG